jgi:universal stress protein E
MKRFKNLLLIQTPQTHFNPLALSRAMQLAQQNQAHLNVVYIFPESVANPTVPHEALLTHHYTDIAVEILQYHPIPSLLEKIKQQAIDLVLIADPAIVTDLTQFELRLMRQCPVPLWIVRPNPHPFYKNILAAIDPDSHNPQRHLLNRLVIELGVSLSEMERAKLHVVHAWHLKGESELRHSAFMRVSEKEVARLRAEEQAKHQADVEHLVSTHPTAHADINIQLLQGVASEVIPRFVEAQHVDLLIMGTVGRTGLSGLIMGNTAEGILKTVQCSVLTVKPYGME